MRYIWSHLLQMRGLKLISTSLFAYRKLSHLLQMRGLKLMMYFTTTIINGSHLLQMRGLKPKPPILYNQKLCCRIFYRCVDWNLLNQILSSLISVASFTDAWIETYLEPCGRKGSSVASFTDAWIETFWIVILSKYPICRIFYRCVDWNKICSCPAGVTIGRIFYRCVDWNKVLLMRRLLPRVASFTDAWIETYFRRREQYLKSRIFYRCVDLNFDDFCFVICFMCRIFYRCVDWNKAS